MITIKVNSKEVWKTCIKNYWYTEGTDEEFEYLLNVLCDSDKEQTNDSIINIAKDIYAHSNLDKCYNEQEHIDNIAFYILNDCCTYFID